MANKTLAEIRQEHTKRHAGFIWDCRRDVDGQECRHVYQDALIREDGQRTPQPGVIGDES
jgi:hypothetical protein